MARRVGDSGPHKRLATYGWQLMAGNSPRCAATAVAGANSLRAGRAPTGWPAPRRTEGANAPRATGWKSGAPTLPLVGGRAGALAELTHKAFKDNNDHKEATERTRPSSHIQTQNHQPTDPQTPSFPQLASSLRSGGNRSTDQGT